MSQKQTLSLNAVIDLIQPSGQIVPLEQSIPSGNRSQCTTRHERLRNVARDQYGPSQKIFVFFSVKCSLCLVSGDIQYEGPLIVYEMSF